MPDPIDPGTNSLLRLIIIVFLVLAICGSLGGSGIMDMAAAVCYS